MEMAMNKTKESSFRMHPQKFAMWLFIVTVVMLFAALTSAYVVKQSSGVWLDFDLPFMFDITTGIVIVSSVFMHMAYLSAKRNEVSKIRIYLLLTVLTGISFLVGQLIAWQELVQEGVFFVGNPAGSFVYVLSGVHGFHLLSGVVFLLIVAVAAFKYKVHSTSLVRIEMCATYWHFLGGLWLYLYLFLTLNH
ncbi:cytochrome c oxidase subunit 3 [Reichenbachiella agariperforans]|uniref:Cytochrome c oxidase subunit 3 n=2 Tax=Reichenbachiellaceae TaxID=2762302 RepID=A0A1M6RFV2_REIAG|nr:cytochrome c oxidase subunit 3 [Reichenbachiella agariperforans]SHK31248.1 cytochrome c oxidase subunit 3 [Reichenbachiella agariperforans]